MSTAINLRFEVRLSTRLLAHGVAARVIRLRVRVQFWTGSGWTPYEWAILDPGSPFSLLPRSSWQGIQRDVLTPSLPLRGIAPQKPATVSGRLAEMTCQFVDDRNVAPPLPMRAFLLRSDRVPLVIGMEDCLTECQLLNDFPHDRAFLEFA